MPADGVLVVDKPQGITSRTVTTRIKRLLQEKKTGHLGTLDPLATGVLPIVLGKATRLARFLERSQGSVLRSSSTATAKDESEGTEKEYLARIKLGVITTTQDADGEVVSTREVEVTEEEIREAAQTMVGEIEQVSPRFSAKKHKGKPLYQYARSNEKVTCPSRRVLISELTVERVAIPELDIRVICGPGTYIRALAQDLGEKLGCGAHLSGLRRTRSGDFTIEQAVRLEGLTQEKARESLIPLRSLLPGYPGISVSDEQARGLQNGQPLLAEEFPGLQIKPGIRYRLCHDNLIAVAESVEQGENLTLRPVRVVPLA
jgi:tRNA pseudouridine55 synthase